MNEKDEFYLENILDSILDIEKFMIGMNKISFSASDLHQSAIIKKLEIVGEATKRISDDFKKQHPDTAWRKITGMRDVLIHDYLGTDLEEVWRVITIDLPKYKDSINDFLK